MGLKKGQTNNLAGRPPGKPNKITGEFRDFVKLLLESNQAQILKDLKKVKPYERLAIYERFLKYVLPELKSTELNFEKLSNEQLDLLISKIINTSKNEHED